MVDIRKIDEFFKGDEFIEPPVQQKMSFRAKFLKGAKLIMPSLAAVLVGLIMIFPSLKDEPAITNLDIFRPSKSELEKLHIEKTEFSITDKNNKISTVLADQIDETEPGSRLLKIINPKGVIPIGQSNELLNIVSDTGYYNQEQQFLQIEQNIKAVYTDGTTAVTQYADYDFKKAFGSGNKNVYAYGNWGKLWSEGFEYYQTNELLILLGKSKVVQAENTLWADKQIRYYRLQHRIEAENNVKILNENNTMYARKVIGLMYPDKNLAFQRIEAYDNVRVLDGKNEIYADRLNAFMTSDKQNKIEKIEAYGNVRVLHADNEIYADKMIVYTDTDVKSGFKKIEAFDNVKIITQSGTAKGDYGIYHPDKSELELQHNVVLMQNGNIVRGDKAIYNLETSISRIIKDSKDKKRVSGVITGASVKGKRHEKR